MSFTPISCSEKPKAQRETPALAGNRDSPHVLSRGAVMLDPVVRYGVKATIEGTIGLPGGENHRSRAKPQIAHSGWQRHPVQPMPSGPLLPSERHSLCPGRGSLRQPRIATPLTTPTRLRSGNISIRNARLRCEHSLRPPTGGANCASILGETRSPRQLPVRFTAD